MAALPDLFKKAIPTQTSSSQSTISTSPIASSTTSNLVHDRDYYNDDWDNGFENSQKAEEALTYAQDNSLFTSLLYGGGTRKEITSGLNTLANGGRYQIQQDLDGDGVMEEVSAAQAMADSFDSELDLYIEAQIYEVLGFSEKGWKNLRDKVFTEENIAELRKRGITVERLNNRTWCFSLVDDDGNILEDELGGKGQILFGDWVIPDGCAQGAEVDLSSMLDLMGYDCISKADFIGREEEYYRVISQVEENLNNNMYQSSGKKATDIYGNMSAVQGKAYHSGSSHSSGSSESGGYSSLGTSETKIKDPASKLAEAQAEKIKQAYDTKMQNAERTYLQANKDATFTSEEKENASNKAIVELAEVFHMSTAEIVKCIEK